MLTWLLAHGSTVERHNQWSAWTADPLAWLGVGSLVALYVTLGIPSRRRPTTRRAGVCFAAGVVCLAVAVLSPLDGLSAESASVHMAQHLLLTVVAAPLLAAGGITRSFRAAAARAVARASPASRRAMRIVRLRPTWAVHGFAALHVTVLWVWHAPAPYSAAVRNDLLHAVEHGSFLLTALAVWSALFRRSRRDAGTVVIVLFGLTLQGALLGALLTFAGQPLYEPYLRTAAPGGLDPLADQQLAGVLMWAPGGLVYLAFALAGVRRLVDPPEPYARRQVVQT